MTRMAIKQLYQQYIKPLSHNEQLRLMAIMARDLATVARSEPSPQHSLLELEGLGAEIWEGIDVREYVNDLRTPRRQWREICGAAPYPLLGEDAQDWVSRTRRAGDEHRAQQLRDSA